VAGDLSMASAMGESSCTFGSPQLRVTCMTGWVSVGTALTHRIQVQIKGSVGSIQNTATVPSATPDPVMDTNSDTVTNVIPGSTGK
jgi:hypothetical protein